MFCGYLMPLVLFSLLQHVTYVLGDYDCICNYRVETPLYATPTNTGPAIGYMYEFDCKAVYPGISGLKGNWQAIMNEHHIMYIQTENQINTQICQGNIPTEDIVRKTSTTPTTSTTTAIPTTTSTTTPTPTTTSTTTPTTTSTTTPTPTTTSTTTPKPTTTSATTPTPTTTSTTTPTPTTTRPTTTPTPTTISTTTPTPTTTLTTTTSLTTTSTTTPRSTTTTPTTTTPTPTTTSKTTPTPTTTSTFTPKPTTQTPKPTQKPTTILTTIRPKPATTSNHKIVTDGQTTLSPSQHGTTDWLVHWTTDWLVHWSSAIQTTTNTSPQGDLSKCPGHLLTSRDHRWLRQYKNHCYEIVNKYRGWIEAEDDCMTRIGHKGMLLEIPDADTQTFIMNFVRHENFHKQIWIGLHDLDREEHFKWDSGAPLTYTHWDPNRKGNDAPHRVEDCVLLQPNGLWDDSECETGFMMDQHNHPWICQYPTHQPNSG